MSNKTFTLELTPEEFSELSYVAARVLNSMQFDDALNRYKDSGDVTICMESHEYGSFLGAIKKIVDAKAN